MAIKETKREVQPEAVRRQYGGKMAVAVKWFCIVFSLYELVYISGILGLMGIFLYPTSHSAISLGLILCLAFVLYPPAKGVSQDRLTWYDVILCILSLVTNLYIAFSILDIVAAGRMPKTFEQILGTILVLLILEACRRAVTWIVSLIGLVFFIYPLISEYLPGLLASKASGYQRLIGITFFAQEGIYSSTVYMLCTLIVGFIIFGSFLQSSGITKFMIDVASALMGRFRGGAPKIACLSSAFFAMISGSTLANAASVGVVTIPMMKKAGLRAEFAAAVEAVASNGGPVTPPVMGAVVFVMMDFLGINYVTAMVAAAIPALLYYLALLSMIDLEAAKKGLLGLKGEELPSLIKTLTEGWYCVLPFVVLIYFLAVLQYSAQTSVIYSLLAVILVSFFRKESRLGPKKIISALETSVFGMPQVGTAVGMAGILTGALAITGVGLKITGGLVEISGGNVFIILVLAGIVAAIMGMGLPAISVYLLVAILMAPALVMQGVLPIAAHMFLLYWGMTALITPPVCAAVFVTATIAQTSFMRAGWEAMRLGSAIYIVPFMFVYTPALLLVGTPLDVARAFVFAAIGIYFLSCGLQGYFLRRTSWVESILFLAGAFMQVPASLAIQLAGVGVGLCPMLWQLFRREARTPMV